MTQHRVTGLIDVLQLTYSTISQINAIQGASEDDVLKSFWAPSSVIGPEDSVSMYARSIIMVVIDEYGY